MSGTAYNWHKWLGTNPLPFYDDPANAVPWGRAPDQTNSPGAQSAQVGGIAPTAQDTGWTRLPNPFPMTYDPMTRPGTTDWSAPSTDVPYTAPSTMGAGAGTWDLPGWAYGGNQKGGGTYNQQTGQWDNGAPLAAGSDVFGAKLPVGYDSAQDRGGLEYNGRNVETFWSRMLRFAKDSGLPPDQAMQAALDRIRRDNGGTLAGTGFQEGGTGATGATGGNTGGSTVDPSNGTGLPIPGGIPTAPTIPATGAGGAGGALNSMGGAELYNDPKLAWRYIMQQAGADPDYQGPFSGFMQQEYMPLMMAFLNAKLTGAGRVPGAQGLAGMDQIGGMLGQFGGMLGGNDLYTRLGQAGQAGLAAGGGLLNQASSSDAENFVRQMLGLTGAGNGPLAQSAQQYLTNKMTGAYSDANLGQRVQGKFGDYLNSSGFLDRLRQLGLLP